LLSPGLLQNSLLVNDFRILSKTLGKGLGWHYLLDLVWCAKQLNVQIGDKVLDAGAGWGLIQFWLAEQGIDVISADRKKRKNVPQNFTNKYLFKGYRKGDLIPEFREFLPSRSPRKWINYPQKLKSKMVTLYKILFVPPLSSKTGYKKGIISIYNQDLRFLRDIKDNSLDWIVSISSLEHNNPEDLIICLKELERIAKPGAKLTATLCASKGKDWFHEPSGGWCFTEATLQNLFGFSRSDLNSNFSDFDVIFDSIVNCHVLRENLSDFYFQSGDNGMPWGVWDPKYIPVGIVKVF